MKDLRTAPSFQNTIQHKLWYDHVKKAIDDYDTWFVSSGYNKYDYEQAPAIVITESPLAGNYLSFTRNHLGIISLAEWNNFFKPGSALEYILTSIQRLSLRLCYGSTFGSHFPTRGCIWDFHGHQPDVRISAFLGFLCDTCRQNLRKTTNEIEFKEIEALISNEWIGNKDNPLSVAALLAKNYKYELRRATGLSPRLFSSISESMKTEVGKFFFDIIKWVLIALITIAFASYFPAVYKSLQK